MSNFLLANEPVLRLAAFFGIFLAVASWEVLAPRRKLNFTRTRRWPSNLGIVALNTLILRLVFPAAAVGVAVLAQAKGFGLFNSFPVPYAVAVVVSVIALDLIIYLQHVLVHAVPALWRLHRMHHADLDYDVTTGARFHPIEIVLSMLIKLASVSALGAPPVAVLIFEVLLNATAMFNHGNVRLPRGIDRLLRLVVVTPDMHRVHHSVIVDETNSNFGFNLPWWDRLFGTYRDQPALGHEGMTIGIEQFRTSADLRLDRMLIQPLRGETGDYPITRPLDERWSIDDVQARLQEGRTMQIFDVRTRADYDGASGHIERALNVPLEELDALLGELVPFKRVPIAIFCTTDKRSTKVAQRLQAEGFSDVHVVTGGMTAWRAAGLPTSFTSTEPETTRQQRNAP